MHGIRARNLVGHIAVLWVFILWQTGQPAALAGLMYQDTFNRTGNLNGSSPTLQVGTANTWTAATASSVFQTATTGGGVLNVNSTTVDISGYIGFTPTAGNVYTYSMKVNASGGTATDWLAIGFATSGAAISSINAASTLAWMLERNNATAGQTFYGGGAANAAADGVNGGTAQTLTMVLDTRTALNSSTVSWYVNGAQQRSVSGFDATNIRNLILGAYKAGGTYNDLAFASGSTWLPASAGSWATAANWSGSLIPNAAGSHANLASLIGTSASAITLDGSQTVGQLTLANSTYNGGVYTVAPGSGGTLTLDNSGSGAVIASYWGANAISAPVYLNDNAQVNVSNGGSLTLSGAITSASGKGLTVNQTVTGAAGSVVLNGMNAYSGSTTVNAGTLTAAGSILLADNFSAAGNPSTVNLNYNLANRQTGSAAQQNWTASGNAQVGNPTNVGQPGSTPDYLLVAFGGSGRLAGLGLSSANVPGPLKISFDIFPGTGGDSTTWTSFAMSANAAYTGHPVVGSGELGFLYRNNTGIQIFNNGADISGSPSATTGGNNFSFYLADTAGTGSPFAGSGTSLVVMNGNNYIGSYALNASMTTRYLSFYANSDHIGGVDNLSILNQQTNSLPATTAVSLPLSGATLALDNVLQTVASLDGVAGSSVSIGPFSRLTVSNATDCTFAGTLSGTLGRLTKTGTGTLTLSGSNTYSGGTVIGGGTLVAASTNALGATNVVVAFTGTTGALDVQTDGGDALYNFTMGAGSTGSIASDVKTGGTGLNHTLGTLTLSSSTLNVIRGPNVASGSPSLTFASLNLSAGSSGTTVLNPTTADLIVGSASIANNSFAKTLQLGGTSAGSQITGVIANGLNTVTVTKTGAGTWTLGGINTYTGPTTVSAGTLTLAANRSATASAVTVGDTAATTATLNIQGDLPMGGNNFFVGTAGGATGIVNQTAGTVSFSGGNALLVGNGGGGVVGTYNMSGGTMTGYSNLNRGIMLGVNAGSSGNPIYANFNLSGTGVINMPGNTLMVGRYDAGGANYTTTSYTQTGGTATFGVLAIAGQLANGIANFSVTGGSFSTPSFGAICAAGSANTATLTIGGTADVTLPAFPTARGTSCTATLTLDGGTLRPYAASGAYLSGLTHAYLTANGGNFSIGAGNNITVSQVLEDAASQNGRLTKSGVGQLTLTSANSYSGGTSISNGMVRIDNGGALGSSNVTVAAGANLMFWGSSAMNVANNFILNGSSGSASYPTLSHDGGAGLVTLNGQITLNATSDVGIGGSSWNDMRINGKITGPGGLIVDELSTHPSTPTETLLLYGANDYAGGTTLTGGRIYLCNPNGFGTGPVTINNGNYVSLWWNAGSSTITNDFVLNGIGAVQDAETKAALYADGGSGGGYGTYTASGQITLNATSDVGGDVNNNLILSGKITGTGVLVKNYSDTVTLSGAANDYSGGTLVNSGVLQVNNASALGSGMLTIAGGAQVTVNHSGTTTNAVRATSSGVSTIYIPTGNNPTLTGDFSADANTGSLTIDGSSLAASAHSLTLTGNLALGAKSLIIQGNSANSVSSAPNQRSTLNNATVITSGDLQVGRALLTIGGNSVVTVGGKIRGSTASPDWGTVTIQDSANVTATGGVDDNGAAAWALNLNGGTLTTPYLKVNDRQSSGQTAYLTFNGTRVVATQDTNNFVQIDGNGGSNYGAYLGAGGALIDSGAYSITIATLLKSSGPLTKYGAGTLTLSGANTYSGQTYMTNGTLVAANSAALGSGGHVAGTMSWIYDGATLGLQGGVSLSEHFHVWGAGAGGNGAIRSLSGNNSLTDTSGGVGGYALRTSPVVVGVDAGNLNVTGFYNGDAGSYGIRKVGGGTLTLTGRSSYNNGTTVDGGFVVCGIDTDVNRYAALGLETNINIVTVNNGGVLTGTVNNWMDNTACIAGGANAHTVVVNSGGKVAGAPGCITGLGNLTLSGGTLECNTGYGGSGWNGCYTVMGDITVSGSSPSYITTAVGAGGAANIQMSNGSNGVGGTRTLTVADVTGTPASDLIISAQLISGTMVKAGPGMVELAVGCVGSGSAVSWRLDAGTLKTTANNVVGTSANITGTATGTLLDLDGTTQTVGSLGASGAGNGYRGVITNGTINLNGNNAYLQNGTFTMNLTGGGGSRLWVGGDAAATVYLGGVNTSTFTDSNSTIMGYPSYGNAGTIRLLSSTALGPASQNAQLFAGTLDLNGQTGVTGNSLLLASSGSSTLVNDNTSAAASYPGGINLNTGTPNIGGAGSLTLGGILSNGNFNKIGSGTLYLTGNNTHGGTNIFSAGVVNVATLSNYGSNGALGNRASDSSPGNVGLLFRGGTLQYTGATPQSTDRAIRISTAAGAILDASGSVPSATMSFLAASSPDFFENPGSRTLTLTGTNTGTNTFNMAIAEAGGQTDLVKAGSGQWVLTGSSSYTGGTTVNAGTLTVAGAGTLGGGDVLVSGGTLALATSTAIGDTRRLTVTGGTADMAGGVNETVQELVLGTQHMWIGTWGGPACTTCSHHDVSGRLTGTGMITVLSGPPHPAMLIKFM